MSISALFILLMGVTPLRVVYFYKTKKKSTLRAPSNAFEGLLHAGVEPCAKGGAGPAASMLPQHDDQRRDGRHDRLDGRGWCKRVVGRECSPVLAHRRLDLSRGWPQHGHCQLRRRGRRLASSDAHRRAHCCVRRRSRLPPPFAQCSLTAQSTASLSSTIDAHI